MLRCKFKKARSSLLPKCIDISTRMGTVMETEWAILSKHEWFDKKQTHTNFIYDGLTKFPLSVVTEPS